MQILQFVAETFLSALEATAQAFLSKAAEVVEQPQFAGAAAEWVHAAVPAGSELATLLNDPDGL